MHKKSIVYLNYSPYENSGHILEYLLQHFEYVYVFSIAFHVLGKKVQENKFSTYRNGDIIKEEYLSYLNVSQKLVLLLIPVRSILNAAQIVQKIISIRKNGKIDIYFTVNAFTAVLGILLKKIRFVDKTVFWVWDYYPPDHPSQVARLMRKLYWQFDAFATRYSDRVIYLHKRLVEVRKKAGIRLDSEPMVIPIGTGEILPLKKKDTKKIKIGFIGVLKKSQGIDLLLKSASVLSKHFKSVVFEIIGAGPDDLFFRENAKNSEHVVFNFHGYVTEKEFEKILYDSTIGIAPYSPHEATVSKYTDPGKPKRYIEFNLPVITTDVIDFSREIKEYSAGEVIKYDEPQQLTEAIQKIIKSYDIYAQNTLALHKKYYYKKLYQPMFENL